MVNLLNYLIHIQNIWLVCISLVKNNSYPFSFSPFSFENPINTLYYNYSLLISTQKYNITRVLINYSYD